MAKSRYFRCKRVQWNKGCASNCYFSFNHGTNPSARNKIKIWYRRSQRNFLAKLRQRTIAHQFRSILLTGSSSVGLPCAGEASRDGPVNNHRALPTIVGTTYSIRAAICRSAFSNLPR
jgi:hypothetical protein